MSAKFTLGPWHWESDEVKGDPYNRVRYQVTAVGETITRIYYSSYEGGQTNAEANARLIAAAPDLLEALIGMCDIWRSTCSIYGWDVQHLSQYDTALCAIAKATGESE